MNESQLVETSGLVEVHNHHGSCPFDISAEGQAFVVPVTGGIYYNVRVGDPAFGRAVDHVEPCVATQNPDRRQNLALSHLICIGNEATVLSGEAKGDRGVVTGKHGGVEHILVDFPPETLTRLVYGDRILIRIIGRGLVFEDWPGIKTLALSPRLARAMSLRPGPGGKLIVPVAASIPSLLMGAGLGWTSQRGDYDLMTTDKGAIEAHGLDRLRLGDLVGLTDQDNLYGRAHRRGAVTVGIIIHGDSRIAGHGPGVTSLFTAAAPLIQFEIHPGANIANLLGLGAC